MLAMTKMLVRSVVGASALFVFGCAMAPAERFHFPTDLPTGRVDAESAGPNSWRVLHSKPPGIRLGSCATEDGGFLTDACVTPTVDPPPSLVPDLALRKDLNSGEFHYYSTLLSVNTSGNVVAPVAAGSATVIHSTHRVVVEWTRYRTQPLPQAYKVTAHPVVNGLDVGIAIRLIFDVQLAQQDGNLAASFGFGQIAASIASRQAQVQAHFEQRGTTFSFVPDTLITISSVEDFIKALNAFYKAFTYMNATWDAYVNEGQDADVKEPVDPSAGPQVPSDPTAVVRATVVPVTKPSKANVFVPAIIGYYVTGVPGQTVQFDTEYATGFTQGVAALAKGTPCAQMLRNISGAPEGRVKGVTRAYRSITAAGLCDDSEISDAQINAAKAALPKR